MKKLLILLVTLTAVFLLPMNVVAQDSNKKVSNVVEGQEAPFDGILLSPEAYADLAVDKAVMEAEIKNRVELEVTKATAQYRLTINNLKAELRFQEDTCDARLKIKSEALDIALDSMRQSMNQSFWDKNKFSIGYVSGAATIIGTGIIITNLLER